MEIDFDQNLTPEEKIKKAKISLQQDQPFFAYLLSTLDIEADPDVGTIGVNTKTKRNIFYNPDYIKETSLKQTQGLLIHEIGHIIFNHYHRQDQDPKISNIAQDIVVNDIIQEAKLNLPQGGLVPSNHRLEIKQPQGKNIYIENINKKSSEQVYEILEKTLDKKTKEQLSQGAGGQGQKGKKKQQGGGAGQDEQQGARIDQHNFGNSEPDQETKEKIKQKIIEASTYAKSRGELPSKIEARIKELTESKLDWRSLLYRYVANEIPFDYTWQTPHKKSHSLGTYLPNIQREKLELVLALDTSGSISDKELQDFAGEVLSIVNSFQNIELTILEADTEIQKVIEISNYNKDKVKNLEIVGRGGTDHYPVFEWVQKNKPNARLLICFTDGHTRTPTQNPYFDTLWVLPEKENDPDFHFGKVIIQESE